MMRTAGQTEHSSVNELQIQLTTLENAGVVQAPDALYRVPEFKSYSINIVLLAPHPSPGKAYF